MILPTSAEIADLVLSAFALGKPLLAEDFLGFPPMLLRATFGTALPQPNVAGDLCDLALFPGFHGETNTNFP